jgi:hypothetical protein
VGNTITMEIKNLEIKKIDKLTAIELVFDFHYSKIMPKLTEHFLGAYLENELVGVITLGWGVRPVHTIKLLFPSMERTDYYEIGKMCMREDMPKNSESVFLSRTIDWIRQNTKCKVLFTWADGILGKPGYVYQAANFMYGGFIWTDLYITDTGEKVHPRTSQTLNDKTDTKYGHRPTKPQLKAKGWSHYRGKQFRYVYFICDKREKKRLLKESPMDWTLPFPKNADLEWKIQDLDTGEWQPTPSIIYDQTASNKNNKTVISNSHKIQPVKKLREFFEF